MPAILWIRQSPGFPSPLQDAGEHGVCIKKRTDKRQISYVGAGSLAVKKQTLRGMGQKERIRFRTEIQGTCTEKRSGL